MAKKIIVSITIILAGLLVFMLWMAEKQQQEKKQQLEELIEEVRPLETEKTALEKQVRQLEADYEKEVNHMATEEILVTELSSQLYSDLFPLMQEYTACGVLALSEEEFPENEEKITAVQFKEILDAGWSYCLAWDGEGDLEEWLDGMENRLEELNLELPNTIYLSQDDYSLEMDSVLQKNGISIIVCQSTLDVPEMAVNIEEGNWIINSCPWNFDGVKSTLSALVKAKGNLPFTVSFTGTSDMFYSQSFRNMLIYIADYQASGDLLLTNFENARSSHQDAAARGAELQSELDNQKEELENQISELERQIAEIYSRIGDE